MKKVFVKESVLLKDNASNPVIADSITMLRDAGFDDEYIRQFTDDAIGVFNDYAELIGEGVKVEYILSRGFTKVKLTVKIPGDSYDPFESGSSARERKLGNIVNMNLNTGAASVSYNYALGSNIIAVSVPLSEKRRALYKDPVVVAIILGIVLGFLCRQLPGGLNSFLVDELASPLMTIMLNIISGIMGPVIFISITTSIIALENINNLTNLGFRIMGRFVLTTLFIIAVAIAVSAIFFESIGTGSISFAPHQLTQMLLDIIPTNLFSPFVENNTPQILILGLLLGSALLSLGDRVSELNELLLQVNEWIMSAMKIILVAIPAIPFLSLFTSIARGTGSEFLEGWKFIAASYISFTICTLFKAAKTSYKTGIGIADFWNRIKPAAKMGFSTGSTAAPLKKFYDISEGELGIKREFTSFWIPMCSAMLSPKTTINVVIATFMVAEMTGIAISNSFILILILITLELSIATPGSTAAWAIMFETLSMPTSYVGYFTVYRMFTNNYFAGCTIVYDGLEEYEAAHKLGGMSDRENRHSEEEAQ